jgi:hypothetical protein
MKTHSRVVIAFVISAAVMVLSSPIIMFINPSQVSAVATTRNSNIIDNSGYHSTPSVPAAFASPLSSPTPMIPSATNLDSTGEFTTQAALSLTRATQTNNFVNSKSYYDISFRTATAGAIKTITMDFPTGTSVGSALVVEAVGIGPGTLAASAGEVLTYTVTNAVNVPALTNIRIQISNINNPPTPSGSFTVIITTRNAANGVIDGPTPTSAYNMVQVGNAQIAPGAVTTTKIASGAVTTGDLANGAVTTTKIADDAVTGEKIVGIDKLVFGTCTGTIPAMTAGNGLDADGFSCSEPLADGSEEVVGMVTDNDFGIPLPVLINVVPLVGQVFFWFTSPYDEGTGTITNVKVSYVLFEKP